MPSFLRLAGAAALALLASGCQSVFFGVVNRGSAQPAQSVVYDADRALALDIYRPAAASGPAPVVVFFYGGAWRTGTRAQYRFVGSRLAEQGVLAIVADYRTWPDAAFPAFIGDAARAVRWTRDHAEGWGGDPQRLYLAGHSAGAHIAALLGTDARHLAAVDMAPGDLAGVIGLAGPYEFTIGGRLVPVFGPREGWPGAMPLRFVDGDEPPFLLIHGDNDRTVDVANSVRMDAALRDAGVQSRLRILPGASHFAPAAAFYSPDRAPDVLPQVRAFIGLETPSAPEKK
ncbi:alpha/beta hydrolase [Luteimonas deserti]|uniref:Alpha/beta hydrolase n=1 Tax=Luteimonas deserti TaxID=2752306 RepID=A0A7Z0TTC2_9GAMM|nr:alpha/beta hydrolase [Luteimonas deserti]NYZ61656.1 alpha/beta hydrolase [Luteimonas deserti]